MYCKIYPSLEANIERVKSQYSIVYNDTLKNTMTKLASTSFQALVKGKGLPHTGNTPTDPTVDFPKCWSRDRRFTINFTFTDGRKRIK